MEKVIIFGTGDISQIAYLYLLEDVRYKVVGFTVDQEYIVENKFFDKPLVAFETIEKTYSPHEYKLFIPFGYTKVNLIRKQKFFEAKEKGYAFITYIHPKATIGPNTEVGENCFIFENNNIQPYVVIEDNCMLWSGNHIGHHSIIRAHVFIASHVVISGRCEVGEGTFIGVNATVRDHVSIGEYNVIGANALILNNTKDNEVYMEKSTQSSRVPSNKLRGI
ncbi:acetyltransferase [Francisella philomiragia]|uniref:acetyltransferase n=1 Tax=Francisella philomiragia TaxID=28110 RepID=UPI003518E5D4